MQVADVMTRDVIHAPPHATVEAAIALLARHAVRHLPVLEDGVLVGIVSDRDLRAVGGEHPGAPVGAGPATPLAEVARTPVWTAHPRDPVQVAAATMRDQRVGALPVEAGGALVGIVASSDLLAALLTMTGAGGAATRIEVDLPHRPGALAEVLRIVADAGVQVRSVVTPRSDATSARFALQLDTIDARTVRARLQRAGFAVSDPGAQDGGA